MTLPDQLLALPCLQSKSLLTTASSVRLLRALPSLISKYCEGALGVVDKCAADTLGRIVRTVTHCKFEASDAAGDEVVLMKIVQVCTSILFLPRLRRLRLGRFSRQSCSAKQVHSYPTPLSVRLLKQACRCVSKCDLRVEIMLSFTLVCGILCSLELLRRYAEQSLFTMLTRIFSRYRQS